MNAPNFTLPDQNGTLHTLSDYNGQWRIVYFYPKDKTPTCTTEACNFRDHMNELTNQGIRVFGISADSVRSHKLFEKKIDLNFLLLSDESRETIKNYNAWGPKTLFGNIFTGILRKTFLINPDGTIVKEYENMNVSSHAQEIIHDVKTYTQK
jgi:peroxiredoxin Q/BCP